ncbi:MAG: LysR family transcriptional regulator, partial [Firmicutes bacterium]|nr:LysR family transcriptional regulator [Bacillota bacterium]
AVYKTGGINRAAKLLEMAPPTLSHNIKQLEKQIGRKLFIASKKGSDPTGEATALFPMVESAFESLLKFDEQLNATNKGTIRIGLTTMHASFLLAGFIREFRVKYPDVRLEYHHHPAHDYLAMLEKNEIDVAIHLGLREPTGQMHNFELPSHPMVFFTTRKFVAQHGIGAEITLEKLTELPLVVFGLMKTRSVLTKLEGFYDSKFTVVEALTTHSAFDMAMHGQGIGYFFEEYLDAQSNDQIIKLKLKDVPSPPNRVYSCAYNKKPSSLVSRFIKELRDFYGL